MKKVLLLAVMSVLAVACGKDDKNPFSNAKEAVEEKDLQAKNFESDCSTEAIDGLLTWVLSGGEASVKSSRVAYRFEGSNFTRATVFFANLGCDGEAFRYNETGTFDVDKNNKTNDGGYAIKLHYNKLSVKIESEVGAKAANAKNACGIKDWAAGQEREVSAQANDVNCYGAVVPRTIFNIYRIDDGNTLYFGDTNMKSSEKAPASLSKTKYVAR